MLVGAAIGLEREAKNKAAGLRTHILVSLGAAIFTLVPILLGEAERSADVLSRVIQGVATGIGFVGAGEILRDSQPQTGQWKIVGLTSAAAIWVSAALGVAAACGLWSLSFIGTALALVVLRVVKKLEHYI
jgi:putative Mg2+ transporter-C (MgtC) family protein